MKTYLFDANDTCLVIEIVNFKKSNIIVLYLKINARFSGKGHDLL